ncbi:MAG TPA: ribosome recycling factor [Tepidisphaeraceae bacterium]|jgi:ribosome recycling factor|nr:ribosome recycling factor [Tepidisphaeraceae bacterium]
MPADDILMDAEESMEKGLDHLKHELRAIRTGRATPALVENIRAEYYGTPTELRAMASISIPEATQLLIKPFDPGSIKYIEKAINESKLGVTAQNDGKSIRLRLPPMSQERRQQMVGQCKGFAETAKVSIRNARRDANKLADTEQKGSLMTEDEASKLKEEIQELTKTYEGKVDDLIEKKRAEVMEV